MINTRDTAILPFLEALPIGVFVLDANGQPFYQNPMARELTGVDIDPTLMPDDLASRYGAYIAGTDKVYPAGDQPVVRALSGQGASCEDMELRRPSGGDITVAVTATPLFDNAGNVEYALATFQDITERKRVEEALFTSEVRFRQVWESTSDAMALSDAEGIVFAANPAYLQLYGYSLEQIIGQSFAIIFPEENRRWALEGYLTAFAGEATTDTFEAVVYRADGTERMVESRMSFITEMGQRTALLSTIRDVTERKQAENARLASEQRFQIVAREPMMPFGIVISSQIPFGGTKVLRRSLATRARSWSRTLKLGIRIFTLMIGRRFSKVRLLLKRSTSRIGPKNTASSVKMARSPM